MLHRLLIGSTLAALAILCGPSAAQADTFPTRPIQVVITTPPGSATDAILRFLSADLTKSLGQSIVVQNRANASGTIGADAARRAAPDGYTLFIGSNTTMAANVHLFKSLSYDPLRDFDPITQVSINPLVLVVRSNLPIHSVAELVAYVKARPGQMNFGVGNAGSRVAAQSLLTLTGTSAQDIAFTGTTPAVLELVGGRLDFMFVDPVVVDSFIKQGTLRALAVSSSIRLPSMPETVTMAAAGIAGYDYSSWLGLYAPHGTPKPVIDKLNAAFVHAIDSAEAKEFFRSNSAIGKSSTPAQLLEFNKAQIVAWKKYVADSGLEVQ
ncbi:tripartite tricarboxylate transporter substrate binding protein [soil metagenome]